MKFELNESKRPLTDSEILEDITIVSKTLGSDYISIANYKKYGKFSQTAIQRHFGTWRNALFQAGLRTERNSSQRKMISDDDYFTDLKRVAELLGSDTVPYESYRQYGKYSAEHIFSRFGKWNIALKKAGLNSTGFSKEKVTEQQCFNEIERIWMLLGRQPTSTDLTQNRLSIYSLDTYKRRFGSWRKALEAFVSYANGNQIASDSHETVT